MNRKFAFAFMILIGILFFYGVKLISAYNENKFNNTFQAYSFENSLNNFSTDNFISSNEWSSDFSYSVKSTTSSSNLFQYFNFSQFSYLIYDYNSSSVNEGYKWEVCDSCSIGGAYIGCVQIGNGLYGTQVSNNNIINISSYSGIKCLNLVGGIIFGGGTSFNYLYLDNVRLNYDSNYQVAFSNNQNITRYLSIAQNTILTNAYLNLSGYNNSGYCYQESANVSTLCGGLNTGVYFVFDNWHASPTEASKTFDGYWDTYGISLTPLGSATMNVNYTKPNNSVREGTLWEVKDSVGMENLTIPQSCWDYSPTTLTLIYISPATNNADNWKCRNNTADILLRANSPLTNRKIYEEAMIWNISSYSNNSNLYVGNNKVWNYTNIFNITQRTNNLANSINLYLSSCSYISGYCYVPFTFYSDTAGILQYSNLIFNDSGFIENKQTFNNQTLSNSLETFSINISTSNTINSANLVYNNTIYPSDSINNFGNDYIISKSINVPIINSNTNKSFYWQLNLSNIIYNSTFNNQSINPFSVDNCAVNTRLLLNYTLFDEQTETLIPDSKTISVDANINIFDSNYNNLIYNYSFHSTTNNTKFCISNLTSTSSYYMDVQTQYSANTYSNKFNNIQMYLLNNQTIPIQVPLYDLNSSFAQEFTVTFKDSNFAPKSNVLVDVSRKYISEGIFRSVEVPKTDSDGQTLVHLQLSTVIYTLTFKYNGQILAILDNVLAKCTALPCTINVNAYSSSSNVNDFNYINGVNINQNFNKNTKTITATFISNSGTKTIILNVTKYDLFGNSSACSSTITSSSGTLSCTIPDSFGNTTFISEVYSNGVLIKTDIINIPNPNPDNSGSYIILAILIVITLSMLFISDVRGILLGGFLGLILSGLLLYLNGVSLFSLGSAGTFFVIFIGIILYKVNQREAR